MIIRKNTVNTVNAPRAYSLGSRPGYNNGNNNEPSEIPGLGNSSEMSRMPTIINSQLLHPSSSSSPPNYLKKTILCQTAKNIKTSGEFTDEKMGFKLERSKAICGNAEKHMKENVLESELRKRAHSAGSKTW